MTVDEMIILVRVTAEGVKQGVAVAAGELKKLEAEKNKLREELELKIRSSGIEKLNVQLKELQEEKKLIEQDIRIPVETVDIEKLKNEIKELEAERKSIEGKLELHLELKEDMALRERLGEIERLKKDKQAAIQLEIKADSEAARQALKDVNKEIANVERQIAITVQESGIQQASDNLKQLDNEIKNAESSAKEMDKSMSKAGLVAAAAFAGLVAIVKESIDAYNESTAVMNGFVSQIEHVGISTAKALDVVKEKTSDGLINPADVAASIKNLTVYGFTLEQASIMVDRLKDSAAYNRQAHYSLGEAVKVTTEGIKNENSVLADAAGVTKNIAKMYEEYADALGKSTDSLTQAEKVQAVLNGVLTETEGTLGNASQYADSLAGSQQKLASETLKTGQAYGEALAPGLKIVTDIMGNAVSVFSDFIEKNKGLVAALTGMGFVLTATTVAVGAYAAATTVAATALKAFAAAFATVAPWALGIGAAAFAITGLIAVTIEQSEAQKKLNEEIERNKQLLEGTTTENLQATRERIGQMLEEIDAVDKLAYKHGELEKAIVKENDSIAQDSLIHKRAEAYRELLDIAKKYEIQNAENMSVEELANAITEKAVKEKKTLVDGVNELENSIKKETAALKDADNETEKLVEKSKSLAGEMDTLESAYRTLQSGQELSLGTVLDLIDKYPQLAKYLAEEGDLTFQNGEILKEVAKIELQSFTDRLKYSRHTKEQEVADAKARLFAYQLEMGGKTQAFLTFKNMMAPQPGEVPLWPSDPKKHAEMEQAQNDYRKAEQALKDINAQIAIWEDKLNNIGSFGDDVSSKIGNSTSAQKELNKALDEALKKLETEKSLKEMSAEDEIKRLEEIKNAHAKTQDEITSIEIKQHTLRGQFFDQWYNDEIKRINKMTKDGADFSAINDELGRVLNEATATYGDEFPQRLAKITESINDMLTSNAEELAAKLAKIESDGVDQQIAEQERLRDVQKRSIGLTEDPQAILSANEARYKWLVENEKNLTEVQKTEMENRAKIVQSKEIENTRALISIETNRITELESARQTASVAQQKEIDKEIEARGNKINGYFNNIEDMTIDHAQKVLDINKKAADEQKKDLKDQLKEKEDIRKQATKRVIDDIKDRYAKEIRLAEDAANAEIKIYSDKIKEIDDLLKSESRADTDTDQLDKINRLKEQLKFETDETNIYELNKQISQEQAGFDKRKRKESLEDEKSALQDKIAAVKDSLAEQKQALQDLRDAEIKHAEESLERYIAKLSNENEQKKLAVEKETKTIKTELGNRETDNKTSIDAIGTQETTAQTDKLKTVKTGTTNILEYLKLKITDFAAAGKAAGEAYAKAFNAEVENIMSVVSESGSTGGSTKTTNNAYNSYSLYNTFQMPVASPSKVSAEMAYTLEQMTRIR